MKGIKIVEDAVKIFEKVQNRLNRGIEVCEKEIEDSNGNILEANAIIDDANETIKTLLNSQNKAKKIIKNLESLLV